MAQRHAHLIVLITYLLTYVLSYSVGGHFTSYE